MSEFKQQILDLEHFKENAEVRIETLGNFRVWRDHEKIEAKEFGRDKTIQLPFWTASWALSSPVSAPARKMMQIRPGFV